jgi:L-threonylcarbamoyladenylate synthase
VIRVVVVDGAAPDPGVVNEAARLLLLGRLLVYPTETLYAVGGVATADVASRVRRAKGREQAKPLPLIAAGLEQARALCQGWPDVAAVLASRFWPGPLTLVLAARAGLAPELGGGSVALRVPGLRLPRELCERAGALISTSANRSGEAPHVECAAAVAALAEGVTLALDSGRLHGVASSIVDLTGAPRLLRAGAVPEAAIAGALREAGASLQTVP